MRSLSSVLASAQVLFYFEAHPDHLDDGDAWIDAVFPMPASVDVIDILLLLFAFLLVIIGLDLVALPLSLPLSYANSRAHFCAMLYSYCHLFKSVGRVTSEYATVQNVCVLKPAHVAQKR